MNRIDIGDRQKNYEASAALLERLELGLRAVSIMYDEYSADLKSKENIFKLKENIDYRLSSALHMYRLLLQEHITSENYLAQQTMDNPLIFQRYIWGNPHFERIERDISTIFDGIIFNLVSAFDYLSHIICYICQTNKQQTFYWTRLAKAARGKNNDISKSLVKDKIDQVDRRFVIGLYDYRSRLIHEKRDQAKFTAQHDIVNNRHRIRVLISDSAKGFFKEIYEGQNKEDEFTLIYLSFWLIKQTSENFELLLDGLVDEIKSKSNYFHNLRGHKGQNSLILLNYDEATKSAQAVSEVFWDQFKNSG
jgi:hypothetical protein